MARVSRVCYGRPMPNLSVRISEQDVEHLDALVLAVRDYYERMSETMPVAAEWAGETTRSSALRCLLRAWKRGEANEMFDRKLAAEPLEEEPDPLSVICPVCHSGRGYACRRVKDGMSGPGAPHHRRIVLARREGRDV